MASEQLNGVMQAAGSGVRAASEACRRARQRHVAFPTTTTTTTTTTLHHM